MKIAYIDLESTGLDPKSNGIIQIAGIIEIDEVVKEEFNFLVAPFPQDIVDDKALQVNGRSHDEIMTFQDPMIVHMELCNLLEQYVNKYDRQDKLQLVEYHRSFDESIFQLTGYNSGFDDSFLREWFQKCRDKYYGSFFSWPPLDVAQDVVKQHLKHRQRFPDFKLTTVAKTLGIITDDNQAHDALYDIRLTRTIFKKLTNGGSNE